MPTFSAPSAAFAIISRRPIAGLLALMLVGAQLVLSGHGPHELRADEEPSACVVCVLGHNLGSAMSHETASLPALLLWAPPLFYSTPVVAVLAVAGYRARGPPSQA